MDPDTRNFSSERNVYHKEIAHIKELFASEVPFFTKERINEAYQSLRQNKKNGMTIYVRGLDGKLYDFKARTGDVGRQIGSDDTEDVLQEPVIHYEPVQYLIWSASNGLNHPYCNLTIVHPIMRRNKVPENSGGLQSRRSLDETRSFFLDSIQTWKSSQSCRQLVSLLQSIQTPYVDKIIAFACGSLQLGPRSGHQHALILTLLEMLSEKLDNPSISCYVQDPAYNQNDRIVLQDSGIHNLPGPEGFLETDESTLVISCSPDVPVRQIVSDIARPAITIWIAVQDDQPEMEHMTDPDSSRLRKWTHEFYEVHDFPGSLEHFGEVSIHVRKPAMSA